MLSDPPAFSKTLRVLATDSKDRREGLSISPVDDMASGEVRGHHRWVVRHTDGCLTKTYVATSLATNYSCLKCGSNMISKMIGFHILKHFEGHFGKITLLKHENLG